MSAIALVNNCANLKVRSFSRIYKCSSVVRFVLFNYDLCSLPPEHRNYSHRSALHHGVTSPLEYLHLARWRRASRTSAGELPSSRSAEDRCSLLDLGAMFSRSMFRLGAPDSRDNRIFREMAATLRDSNFKRDTLAPSTRRRRRRAIRISTSGLFAK